MVCRKGRKEISREEWEFKSREVFKRGELKNIRSTGYEAFRVSPRTTTIYGKKYKKIYGAVLEPDYSRPTGKLNKYGKPTRFGAKVSWYPHGYTSSKIKSGTRIMQSIRSYPVDYEEARMKLMVKRRKKR